MKVNPDITPNPISDRTKQEIRNCLAYLETDGNDKNGAIRGLNDWFFQSLIEEGYLKREPE